MPADQQAMVGLLLHKINANKKISINLSRVNFCAINKKWSVKLILVTLIFIILDAPLTFLTPKEGKYFSRVEIHQYNSESVNKGP